MSESTLQNLIRQADGAVRGLGGTASGAQLEVWATDVHQSMSAGGRSFHGVGHVFSVAEGGNDVQVLAALFHDTVYLQVDGGFPPRLAALLGDALETTAAGQMLVVGDDPWKRRLADLFGFRHGQILSPFGGLNEYLSALFAVRRLHPVLSVAACLRVATCIEATLPFRAVEDGELPGEALLERLRALVKSEGVELDAVSAVHDAVGLANRDVGNFAYDDTGLFLDNTWQLLPESNAHLRAGVYSIDQYHEAMRKMRGFFGHLDPAVVFRQFRGVPAQTEWMRLRDAAARNLRIGHGYLGAKLLAASVLQALATLTGGDAPISLFMGDLPSVCATSPRLESLLPNTAPVAGVDSDVLHLLVEGRASDGGFDLKNAPLAGFLYAAVGPDVEATLATYESHGPAALLAALPDGARRVILEGCAQLAVTRRDALFALM